MRRYLIARGAQAIAVVAIVATLAFVLVHLAPGDPFGANLDDPRDTPELHAQQMHSWGYDQPLPVQYAKWLGQVARLNFGWSHTRNRWVIDVLRDTVPRTLLLMFTAIAAGLLAGLALGTWQAAKRGTTAERISGTLAVATLSVPEFLLALGALAIPAARWHWFPVSGIVNPAMHDSMGAFGRAADVLRHLVLPAGTLALLIAASMSRYQRQSMLTVLPDEYLRTARAKGADERAVIWRHALRNSLGPVITIVGLTLPALFSGAVFVETIFGWPGVGRMMVEGVGGDDYSLVLAGVLIGSVLVAAGGALADILASIADPRVRVAK